MADAAMGLVRVRHAVEAGLPAIDGEVDATYLEVPPFNRLERKLQHHVERLDRWNFGAVRWHLLRGLVARRMIERQLRVVRPDVAHVTTDQVAFLLGSVQRRIPCVLSLDALTIDWARLKRFIPAAAETPAHLKPLEPLERRALRRAPLVIAWTDTVAQRIRRFAPKANVATLHPGLDLDAFRPATAARASGPLRVLFVGGRWQAKGGPQLLEALAPRLGRGVELDVVTPLRVAAFDGMNVHAAEPGSAHIAQLFARADVFCLPTWVDAVPFVVLEAMASGVPVVSTRVGSIPELIGQGGMICEPGDVEGLAEALGTLLEDPARRRSMGEAGRARAEERYDALETTPRLVDLLRGVAGRG